MIHCKTFELPEDMRDYLLLLQDPIHLAIISRITKEENTTLELAELLGHTQDEMKKRMQSLHHAGLVIRWPKLSSHTQSGICTWSYRTPRALIQNILQECSYIENCPDVSKETESIARKTREQIQEHLGQQTSSLAIMGGEGDGMVFELAFRSLAVGREDKEGMKGIEKNRDIIIPGSYRGVTRISKPHAIITRIFPCWYIEDCNSSGGTYINNLMLKPETRHLICDQDIIILGSGPHAVRLRAHIENGENCDIGDLGSLPIHAVGRV